MSEPHVEIVDLGTWGAVELLAEYDPEDDAIRVNRSVAERVCASAGDAEASRFVACAVAHERYHRAYPHASEQETRQHAARISGFDPERLTGTAQASGASRDTSSPSREGVVAPCTLEPS